MKRVLIRRSISVLCSLALVVTLTAAGAAAQTARGVVWEGLGVYVDGVRIGFRNDAGLDVRALSYDGSVYIPIRTAGEWLGGGAVWDEASGTVSLTRGETPYYCDAFALNVCRK